VVADLSRRHLVRHVRVAAAVVLSCVPLLALFAVASRMTSPPAVIVNVDDVGAAGGAESPREQTASLSITSSGNTALVPAAYDTPTSGHCINGTTTGVDVVTESATSTTGADGPYCTDAATCPAGAVIPIGGRAWARLAAGGPVSIACRFRDAGGSVGGLVPRGGSGGGGDPACELTGDANCEMTGQVRAASGTLALPGIAFSGDPDSGLYRTAANTFSVGVGGSQRLEFSTINPFMEAKTGLRLQNGSAGAPSLNFGNGIQGLYWDGTSLHASVGSASRQSWSSSAATFTVPLLAAAGSAASPSFSFSADTDLGMYRVGANELALAANAGPVLRVGGSTAGDVLNVRAGNDQVGNGGAARGLFYPPRSVGTTTVPPPTCTSDTVGATFLLDDHNDAKPAITCWCVMNADDVTYQWISLSLTAGAATLSTGCAL
jgi:hypothetical protein